uniref:Uncharacterized protein n=1 Tax=Cacopsylla melanoneura TaxID=428564 RepID=A0A8D8SUB4_9HEMI
MFDDKVTIFLHPIRFDGFVYHAYYYSSGHKNFRYKTAVCFDNIMGGFFHSKAVSNLFNSFQDIFIFLFKIPIDNDSLITDYRIFELSFPRPNTTYKQEHC